MIPSRRLLFIIIQIFCIELIFCQSLITVKQDGSGDFTTIQGGVDYANNADTVLVWPGTYYENVVVSDKSIVLGSLTLTTNNPTYIKQTIINGNQSGSCVVLKTSSDTSTFSGFTLTNGSGYYIGLNYGGGLCIISTSSIISNCIIKDNTVNGLGGGISISFSNVYLSGITIRNNHAYTAGGGIAVGDSQIEFDTLNLCNLYLNYAAWGTDLLKGIGDTVHVVVDTFTIQSPDYYYLHSFANGLINDDITWEINNGKIQQTDQNLYVSLNGNNNNDGITPQTPLKDMWFALLKMKSDSLSPDTIKIASGVYEFSTGEKFPLSLKRYASIKGISRDSCILEANSEIYHFHSIINSGHFEISNLTIQGGNGVTNTYHGIGSILMDRSPGVHLKNLRIINNYSQNYLIMISHSTNLLISNCDVKDNMGGAGFIISFGYPIIEDISARIENSSFQNNIPDYNMPASDLYLGGGGHVYGYDLYPDKFHVQFYNCLFTGNRSRPYPDGTGHGSVALGITEGAKCDLINCTFGNNHYDGSLGANIGVTHESEVNIYNSVMYGNTPAELYMFNLNGANSLNVYNSVVHGGEEAIRIYTGYNSLYYDPSNMDAYPIWDTTSMYPYSLSSSSPCIDAGTLDLPPGVILPETDLAGNPRVHNGYVDMGAYEYGPWVGIDNYGSKFKIQNSKLLGVYPNPASNEIQIDIRYSIIDTRYSIFIYDLFGRKQDEVNISRNQNQLRIDISQFPSGVYIAVLKDESKVLERGKFIKR